MSEFCDQRYSKQNWFRKASIFKPYSFEKLGKTNGKWGNFFKIHNYLHNYRKSMFDHSNERCKWELLWLTNKITQKFDIDRLKIIKNP